MVAPLTVPSVASAVTSQRPSLKRNRDHADEYAAMLVRDWLERSGLRTTVQTFDDECTRLDREVPGASEWSRLVELLQSACLAGARRDSVAVKIRPATPLLRLLVESLLRERILQPASTTAFGLPRQQSTIIMTKKTAACDSISTANQREQPRAPHSAAAGRVSTVGSNAHTTVVSNVKSLRPKSAMVCKSMGDLLSRTSDDCGRPQTDEPRSSINIKKQPRPISAATTLGNRGNGRSLDKFSNKAGPSSTDTPESKSPPTDKISRATSLKAIVLPSARHTSTISVASLPQIFEVNDADDEDNCNNVHPQETEPIPLLDEMNEEQLMSQFSSLSREAIKTIRRVRAKSSAYSQEFERTKRTISKIHEREKQRQARRLIAAEQTELLNSTMSGLTNEPCALCQYVFPKRSLVMKVTYKAIYDLRASWAAKIEADNSSDSFTTNTAPESSRLEKPATDEVLHEDFPQFTHFYDEAPICVFCKQLVLHFPPYRPSSAEMRAKRVEAAKAAAEASQHKEAERLRAANRCDPLDFHSYQLNSDEDDSDTEEVLEYGADGRQRIVRRKRLHKINVVANRGLVGKHLHYNTLRSASVQALNVKEWQQITS